MILSDGIRACIGRHWRLGLPAVGAICLLAGIMLAACAGNGGVGTFLVNPGHYSVYHCKDFMPRLQVLLARQNELRNLIEKASESGGGALIGNLSYRAEYEDTLGEEKVLRRTAAEKNCDLTVPTFQSDRTIR